VNKTKKIRAKRIGSQAPWLALLTFVILAVFAAYYPGLGGPYVLDDGETLLFNEPVALRDLSPASLCAAAASAGGPLLRPLSNISFAFNHYFAGGFEPSLSFKLTNVFIHALNTLLMFLLARALARAPTLADYAALRDRVALIAAAMWALHPIQLTNVLYVSQRMNSLSASFVLAGLLLFVHGRCLLAGAERRGFSLMALGVAVGVAGVSAKENAILAPLLAAVIEYTLFRADRPTGPRRRLILFYVAVVGVPALLGLAYLLWHPQLVTGAYFDRDFSPWQRVLTETRVLWFYASLLLLPDIRRLGLFHDDIETSRSLFAPPETLLALAAIAVVLWLAIAQRRRFPVLAFAIAWFFAAHILESSVIGLELVFEHRNYLPSVGVFIATALGLVHLARGRSRIVWSVALLIPVVLALATYRLATVWRDLPSLAEHSVRHHPGSARANELAAGVSLETGNYADALKYLKNGARTAPGEVSFAIDTELLLVRLTAEMNDHLGRRPRERKEIVRGYAAHLAPEIDVIDANGTITLSLASDHRGRIPVLLATQPVRARGMVALDELFHCLTEPPRLCRSIDAEASRWFAAAADNALTRPAYRAELYANSAKLYEMRGNREGALAQSVRATELDPQRPYYQLLLAERLLQAGRTSEAVAILDRLAHDDSPQLQPGGKHRQYFERLRRLAETRGRPRNAGYR
jgi:protein O-mannosyl-transferase